MKILAVILAFLCAGAGWRAVLKWREAARVDFVPFEEINGRLREVPQGDTKTWIGALTRTLRKGGRLNKEAAFWTAVAVVLALLAAIAGVMAS